MRKATLAGLVGIVIAGSPVWATQWAQKMFDETEHNFGTVARAATAEHEFTLTNCYRDDVRITGVRSSCGCTSVRVKDNKRVLKSWESTAVVAHINSDRFLGSKGATIAVTFDRPYPAEAQLRVRAFIRDDVVLKPGSVQLGTVRQGSAAEQAVDVLCSSQGGVRPIDVESDNPHLSVRMVASQGAWGQSSYRLIVRLDEQAPLGYLREHVSLVLGDGRRTRVPVPVEARVVAGVTVIPDRLSIGLVEPGEEVRKTVVVRGSTPFRIRGVRSENNAFRLAAAGQSEAKSTHVLPVTFIAADRPGKVTDTIHIETDQGNRPLEVKVQAEVHEATPAPTEAVTNERVASAAEPAADATAASPADADPPTGAETTLPQPAPMVELESDTAASPDANAGPAVEAEPIPSRFGPPVDVAVDAGPGVAVSVDEAGVRVNVGGMHFDFPAGHPARHAQGPVQTTQEPVSPYRPYAKRPKRASEPTSAAGRSTAKPGEPWGTRPRSRWFVGW